MYTNKTGGRGEVLVEETGENDRPAAVTGKLYYITNNARYQSIMEQTLDAHFVYAISPYFVFFM